MRYKKGSKVEVLRKNEVPSGSWYCAEIISGNGHCYTVRYDIHPDAASETITERVSRKLIRPCPPMVSILENWIPGDVVEVFQNFSWKMATVSKVLVRNYFLVRLLGSFQEFEVRGFDLRVRQSWQDNKWFIIGKGSGKYEDGKHNERSNPKYNQDFSSPNKRTDGGMDLHAKDDFFAVKRGLPCSYSQVEAFAGTAQKFRAVEKKGNRHRVAAVNLSDTPVKVDAVACPREMLGENQTYASYNNRTTRFSVTDVERAKSNGTVGFSYSISLEPSDADHVTSSVGSCSITSNNPFKLPIHYSTGFVEDTEGHCSDAESVCRWGYEEGNSLLPTKEELTAEIRRLELHAYRCTMEALHASGPLSWEQETLVTNLRLWLHISNDEHLMELRNLSSTATSIPIS